MLTILNDVHISAQRSAGTTPATRLELRRRILQQFENLLPETGDLMILGDLFDAGEIDISDLWETYLLLRDWANNPRTGELILVAGNHDHLRSSDKVSSFDFLCKLITEHAGAIVIKGGGQMTPYGYVIPHMPNQALFDLELEKVPSCECLFLHCNVSNGFAAQSDQSLNISIQQIGASPARRILVAHEHHSRTLGKVTIPGNQIASSVSDWLSEGDKQYACIQDDGTLTLHTCAKRADEFCEMPWNALVDTTTPFVRISGSATAAEASDALAAVAAYRRRSTALVVTNAVKIESAEGEDYEEAVTNMAGFDVMSMLRDVLEPSEMKILESLNG